MSLGDALRLLRAQHGGITPAEIEEQVPVLPRGLYRQIEQRYRAVGGDESVRLLADYYGVAYEELRPHLDWPRKALSRALVHVNKNDVPIRLDLRDGETLEGKVDWWDLGAIGLATQFGEVVVQRHAVTRWDPRAPKGAEPEQEANEEDS